MSTMLEATSPAEISQYEEKEGLVWGTFLPYLRFLYNPTTVIDRGRSVENSEDNIMKTRSLISQRILADLHILCCKVLLHGLENALGREIHFQILVKEGLLDYSTCLPAVLPQECKPRARSFVKELGKHRQLQPASLCTLAKAHLAKSFCGLKAVMDMHSIGEFVHNCLSGPLRYIPGVHDNVG